MGKIFVSYRREDSADTTGRLCDRLAERFGAKTIFKDVDSIPIGSDYRAVLRQAVEESNVVLVIVGRQWLQLTDASGQRRLDDPRDFVRIEVEAALARNVPVVPILVQQAMMPSENDLPSSMSEFVYRHGLDIRSDPHFNGDVRQLIDQLVPLMEPPAGAELPDASPVSSAETQTAGNVSAPSVTRIVDCTGNGHYRTIAEAVASAKPGDRILIRPGRYHESVMVDKPLEISGESKATTIVETKYTYWAFNQDKVAAACLRIVAKGVVVRDLSLVQSAAGFHSIEASALFAYGGDVQVEECDITTARAGSASGIEVLNGAVVLVRRTRIHDGGGYGVNLTSGRVTLEDCDITGMGKSALHLKAGVATVLQSRLVSNEEWAVEATAGSQGVIEDNDLRSNKKGPWNLAANVTQAFQRHNNQE